MKPIKRPLGSVSFGISCILLLSSMISPVASASTESEPNYSNAEGVIIQLDNSEIRSSILSSNPEIEGTLNFELHDWHPQSEKVLFTSFRYIGIMNSDGSNIVKAELPLGLYDEICGICSPIGNALFVGNNWVYAVVNNNLLVYEMQNNDNELVNVERKQLDGQITSFGVIRGTNDNSTVANLVLVESFRTVWLADLDGKKISKLFESQLASNIDVSPDGSKIAFVTIENIEGQFYTSKKQLLIFSIEKKEISQVLEEESSCTPSRIRWSPNGQLLTYQQCGGSKIPTATLKVVSLDGSYSKVLYGGVDAPTSYVVNKDGSVILIGIDPSYGAGLASKIYRMDLARPIPEFKSIGIIIMAFSLVTVIMLKLIKSGVVLTSHR